MTTISWGFPPFKIERNALNLGFAGTVNAAAARAQGDYLLMLNQDCEATAPGWADAMLTLFTNPKVGIVGPKLLFPDGSIQSCGGGYGGNKGPFHWHIGWKDANDWRVNTTKKVSWITGAAQMISRTDFWAVGGLDAATYPGGYGEDVDLCERIKHDLHKEIWFCAEATLMHDPGSTGGNPKFMDNMRRFHERWDDKITPDTPVSHVDF